MSSSSEARREAIRLLVSATADHYGPEFEARINTKLQTPKTQLSVGEVVLEALPMFEEMTKLTVSMKLGGAAALRNWIEANVPLSYYPKFLALAEIAASSADALFAIAMQQVILEMGEERKNENDSRSRSSDTSDGSGDSGSSAGFRSPTSEVRQAGDQDHSGDSSSIADVSSGSDEHHSGQQDRNDSGIEQATTSLDGDASV